MKRKRIVIFLTVGIMVLNNNLVFAEANENQIIANVLEPSTELSEDDREEEVIHGWEANLKSINIKVGEKTYFYMSKDKEEDNDTNELVMDIQYNKVSLSERNLSNEDLNSLGLQDKYVICYEIVGVRSGEDKITVSNKNGDIIDSITVNIEEEKEKILEGENEKVEECVGQNKNSRAVGWSEDGLYYTNENGELAKGITKINDQFYHFDKESGMLIKQAGWIDEGEKKYYSNADGVLYVNQFISFGSTKYYMGEDGSVQKGIVKANDGNYYHMDEESGILVKKAGWLEKDGKRYYANAEGRLYRNQFISFGSTKYYMGEDGSVQKGIVKANDGNYYHMDEESGILVKKAGWLEKDGKRYYANAEGRLYRNQFISFGSTKYYMGEDGSVQKGIVKANDGNYYHMDEESGILVKKAGWLEKDGKRYYANAEGRLYRNQFISFGSTKYYMGEDGSVQKGIVKANDGNYYHMDEESGILVKKAGWLEKDGKRYYANAEGRLYRNQFISFGSTKYYMGEDGSVQKGIVKANDGNYYHMDEESGILVKKAGWLEKDGKRYYANAEGRLYRNQFISFGSQYYYCTGDASIVQGKKYPVKGVLYTFDKNGVMQITPGWGEYNGKKYYINPSTGFPYKGWITFGQTSYYADSNGLLVSGWQKINGYSYYFYPSNYVMARNTTINGKRIGQDGRVAKYSDRMAIFSTVSTNNENGTYNMSRALKSFNQVVIQPGQTLSFFSVAGPCGKAQGYKQAGVVGGVGYGGGICQASTTLYGAAVRAGLTIVQRRNHSVPSTYVPIGQDAMVDYGSSDLKFRNDYDYPVKLVTYVSGRTLYAEVWGMQPGWYDYINVRSWSTGVKSAVAYRDYVKNGKTVKTEQLPSSYYK